MTTTLRAVPHHRGDGPQPVRTRPSPWLLLPALVWVMVIIAATNPLTDVDSYWHVLMGQDIVANARFTGDPSWVFGPHHDWVTTQWASEVLFAGLHHLFGWAGLTYTTLAFSIATLITLTRVLRTVTGAPLSHTPVAWVVFALAGLAIAADVQERPATISFLFLVILSGWAHQAMKTGTWPRWWVLVAFTGGWAQLHGYWVMVALTITVVALLRAAEHRTLSEWKTPFFLAAACTLIGAATPAGAFGIYAPLVFRDAAGPFLSEWEPTTLTGATMVPFAFAIVTLTVAAWIRTEHPVRLAPALWVLAWTLFALAAYRNVVPAVILITPTAAAAAIAAWPTLGTRIKGTTLTAATLALIVFSGVGLGVTRLADGTPLPTYTPTRILEALNNQPGERRVLNYYDLGGRILALTRPGIQVAVDGRSDMYGRQHLGPYLAMQRLETGWQETFEAYNPTDVITSSAQPLNQVLPLLGWEEIVSEHGLTLWGRADDQSTPLNPNPSPAVNGY
jgi:hypothetical protein